VVLSPRPFDWTSYLAEGPVASAKFMDDVEDLPVQEREP
jgi:virulence-associated protein VagC